MPDDRDDARKEHVQECVQLHLLNGSMLVVCVQSIHDGKLLFLFCEGLVFILVDLVVILVLEHRVLLLLFFKLLLEQFLLLLIDRHDLVVYKSPRLNIRVDLNLVKDESALFSLSIAEDLIYFFLARGGPEINHQLIVIGVVRVCRHCELIEKDRGVG